MKWTFVTSDSLEQFRAEVRDWLDENFDDRYAGFRWSFVEDPEAWAYYTDFWPRAGAKGWLEPDWPVEFGGAGLTAEYAAAVREEFTHRRVGRVAGIGYVVAPAIRRLGDEELKRRLLPQIAAGRIRWAELYSEPDSGSDLASLTTRAVRSGDDWVVTGQKTFSTGTQHCNWGIVAVRTDPDPAKRHRGISFLLTELDRPGIQLTPLPNMAGGVQNVVFLDEVRIPVDQMLGEENKGWTQVWFGGACAAAPPAAPTGEPTWSYQPPLTEHGWVMDQVARYAFAPRSDGRRPADDPHVGQLVARAWTGALVEHLLAWEAPRSLGEEVAQTIVKEWEPEFGQACMDILGPLALSSSAGQQSVADYARQAYLRSFGNHAGGTSQLKRMSVATRILGLPR